jgi:predicted oxidoreductase
VIVASGGIGGNHDLVRRNWPARLGTPPEHMLCGVPAHVDGRMLDISAQAGGRLINGDRMWHYVEGIENWNPIWPRHAIRILPGPSSLWFDARGTRLPGPLWPGFDTLGTLEHLRGTGYDYSWFILDQQIIRREFALSGSEQNPDLTGKSWRQVLKRAIGKNAPPPVEAFKKHGKDFIVRDNFRDLVAGMNQLAGNELLNHDRLLAEVQARDGQFDNPFAKDGQVMAIHNARRYRGDKLVRTAKPHRILDPANGPSDCCAFAHIDP